MKINDKKRRLKNGLGRKSRLAITPLMRIGHLQFYRDLFPTRVLTVDEIGFNLSFVGVSNLYAFDVLQVYRRLRASEQEQPNYSLDSILQNDVRLSSD